MAMQRLEFDVPDEVAAALRKRARSRTMSLSDLLAEIVENAVAAGTGWPPHFFEDVVGGWMGEPLTRPDQGVLVDRAGEFL